MIKENWIPVNERHPESGIDVLLTIDIHLCSGEIRRRVIMAYWSDEDWLTSEESPEIISYPVAWMPLPEPYKEKQG